MTTNPDPLTDAEPRPLRWNSPTVLEEGAASLRQLSRATKRGEFEFDNPPLTDAEPRTVYASSLGESFALLAGHRWGQVVIAAWRASYALVPPMEGHENTPPLDG